MTKFRSITGTRYQKCFFLKKKSTQLYEEINFSFFIFGQKLLKRQADKHTQSPQKTLIPKLNTSFKGFKCSNTFLFQFWHLTIKREISNEPPPPPSPSPSPTPTPCRTINSGVTNMKIGVSVIYGQKYFLKRRKKIGCFSGQQ
ncbi:unnamed protein product [Meganyctiphanes norvegica]|uniref:Uncharacterized protein n=1 Tax=Meganyctiphanes norvegica TaxID=48144 RepID=A0AAV2R6Z6_MEGNR